MSHIKHDAIVVTCPVERLISQAAEKAADIGLQVLGPSKPVMNSTQSILVCPDGSKEGWATDLMGDEKRAQFIAWLGAQVYEDGSSSFRWVHVEYGEINEAGTALPRVVVFG